MHVACRDADWTLAAELGRDRNASTAKALMLRPVVDPLAEPVG